MPYRVEYSPEAEGHLRLLKRGQQVLVLDAVGEQLTHEPAVETRNRKPMRPNPVARWQLRVYYDVADNPEPVVKVRAVGVKEGNRVRIGGESIDL